MKHGIMALLLAVVMILTCAAFAENASVSVTDMTGRTVELETPATRIVALTASDCEIVCALGAQDCLVGRGEYCDYPESVLDVPSVQSGSETNIEEIIALEPQVVIMSTMAQTTDQADALENAGIRVVISDAQDIEGVYTAIRMIGTLVDKSDNAEAIVTDMQSTFADIAAKSAGNEEKSIYFEVSPLEWGLWTAGSGTFMDELATMCGLKNAFSDVVGWAAISAEQVIERDPDYIVTIAMYYGEGARPEEEIKGRAGWDGIKAVQNDKVFNADSNEISRPGPRLKDAAIALYDFVNG